MDDVRRHKSDVQCKTCYDVIRKDWVKLFYKNGICGECRQHIPSHIPEEQHVRYLLALSKAKKKGLLNG